MIEVKNLCKSYDRVAAVRDLSFSVADRGVYGFLGPNGAGKSTTLNILTGCLPPIRAKCASAGMTFTRSTCRRSA